MKPLKLYFPSLNQAIICHIYLHVGVFCQHLFLRVCSGVYHALLVAQPRPLSCGSPLHFPVCLWTLHSPSWAALHPFPHNHIWNLDWCSSFRLDSRALMSLDKGADKTMPFNFSSVIFHTLTLMTHLSPSYHLYNHLVVVVVVVVGSGDQLHSACAFCVVSSASLQCSCCCLSTPGCWDGGQCGIVDLQETAKHVSLFLQVLRDQAKPGQFYLHWHCLLMAWSWISRTMIMHHACILNRFKPDCLNLFRRHGSLIHESPLDHVTRDHQSPSQ